MDTLMKEKPTIASEKNEIGCRICTFWENGSRVFSMQEKHGRQI